MIVTRRAAKPAAQRRIKTASPLLETGDRLTAREFLRRFGAMPGVKKAELINGIVYMPSPVRARQHGIPDSLLQLWLGTYSAATPGTLVAANTTVRFDADNVPQPDALLMIDPNGNARIGEDGYIHGAPELVVEVAASSAALDLHAKKDAYRRAGVAEYLVWRPEEKAVDWFTLEEDEFVPLPSDRHGAIHSRVFPGLTLAVKALIESNAAAVVARLQRALGSKAHQTFVARMKKDR